MENIVVWGHPLAPIGMGEHIRSVCRSLDRIGLDFVVVDIFAGSRLPASDYSWLQKRLVQAEEGKINIFCINADEIHTCLDNLGMVGLPPGHNVLYPAWELSTYPEEWVRVVEQFDEVWGQSYFTYTTLRKALEKPVFHLPLSCQPRFTAHFSRQYFNIRETSFCYLFSFDFLSYLERKNPYGVVAAFRRVCRAHPFLDISLVVKVNNADAAPEQYTRFKEYCEEVGAQIVIINDSLSDSVMKNLLFLVDCFVSLHRAEGFGFGIAEAMALGTPVVATAYSGNMDFCTQENSFLVDYELVPIAEHCYPFWEDNVWAEPDIELAAERMAEVALDAVHACDVAKKARCDMALHHSHRAAGLRYAERIRTIESTR